MLFSQNICLVPVLFDYTRISLKKECSIGKDFPLFNKKQTKKMDNILSSGLENSPLVWEIFFLSMWNTIRFQLVWLYMDMLTRYFSIKPLTALYMCSEKNQRKLKLIQKLSTEGILFSNIFNCIYLMDSYYFWERNQFYKSSIIY